MLVSELPPVAQNQSSQDGAGDDIVERAGEGWAAGGSRTPASHCDLGSVMVKVKRFRTTSWERCVEDVMHSMSTY